MNDFSFPQCGNRSNYRMLLKIIMTLVIQNYLLYNNVGNVYFVHVCTSINRTFNNNNRYNVYIKW